jgi:hypothetical protein
MCGLLAFVVILWAYEDVELEKATSMCNSVHQARKSRVKREWGWHVTNTICNGPCLQSIEDWGRLCKVVSGIIMDTRPLPIPLLSIIERGIGSTPDSF